MRKEFVLLMSAAMILALGGCAGSNGSPEKEGTESAAKTTTAAAPAKETGDSEAAGSAQAPDWPKKPVTIVVGYTSGGDLDVNARAYAEYLKDILGVDVVVSNVTGASGTVAAQQVKDSEADGYTVFYHQPALMISQLQGMIDYGIEAFDMSCMSAYLPGDIMCVNASLGIHNLQELYDYTQENPNKLNLAASAGTMNYIQALQMQALGFQINIVDGGNATERVANLLGGHVDVILNSYGTCKDYLTTGDFVALATLASDRAKAYSDIPTANEQGYNIYFDKYHYFCFPKGTDPEIIKIFSDAVKQVTENTEYQTLLWDNYGQEPFYMDGGAALETLDTVWEMLQDYKEQLGG